MLRGFLSRCIVQLRYWNIPDMTASVFALLHYKDFIGTYLDNQV